MWAAHAASVTTLADRPGNGAKIARQSYGTEEQAISEPRTNDRIRAPKVRLVGPSGEQVGVVPIDKALRLAADADLDLVEVAPNSDPPVAKIMDFGKFKYEQSKKEQANRAASKSTEMKEVRLGRSVKIDPHDVQIRVDQSRRFLMAGHKGMLTQKFRGREIAHKDIGLARLKEISEALSDVGKLEQTPRWMGKQASIILAPDKVKIEAIKRRLAKEKAAKEGISEEAALKAHEEETRKAVAAALYIKRMSGGRAFTVFIQDPRVSPSQFDLVAVPMHDRLRGPNVIVTMAAPNRITQDRLDDAYDYFADPFEDMPSPRVAVMIGGDSRAYKMTEPITRKLTAQLHALAEQNYSLMITTSRRTGAANEKIIDEGLDDTSAWVWDRDTENPYMGFLAWADIIMVTADSVSMISEAATTGKPVYMIPPEGGAPRISKFHQNLIDRGILRIFDGTLENWTYTPLNDAAFVAEEIRKRLKSGISQ